MSLRPLAVRVVVAAIVALSAINIAAQQGNFKTPWGEPDLQGIWSAGTITPMSRPARWAGKTVLTPEEAKEFESSHASAIALDESGGRADDSYGNAFAPFGGGTNEQLNDRRTSLIVDPPDGQVPPFSPEGVKRENTYRDYLRMMSTGSVGGPVGPISPRRYDPPAVYNVQRNNGADHPENRGTGERCFGQGPPFGAGPATFVRIVQSPGAISLFYEVHQGQGSVRVVNIDNRKHVPSHVRLIHGDSVARWEGDTLVIDTTNFTHKTSEGGSRENLHFVERLSRAADGRLVYHVTMDDATTWTRPWTYEVKWTKLQDETNHYEQSCHEGNFGIIGHLNGRRFLDRQYMAGKTYNPEFLNIAGGGAPPPLGPDGRATRPAAAAPID